MIDVGGEGKLFSVFGDDIAGEAFPVEHHLAVELVFGAEGASFGIDVTSAWRICLNFRECAVFTEDRKRFEKDLIVGACRPIREVVDHEVGGEEISPIATSAIALSGAREFKFRGLQKITLDLEAGIKGVLCVFRGERPEEVRSHAGVKILTDL